MKKILIIEDNPSFRLFLNESLKDTYIIDEASSINEVNNMDIKQYSLILLDNRLPDGMGIDLIEHLKVLSNRTEIIMLTAYGDIPTAIEAVKKGALDFWTKPIDYDVLVDRITHLMSSANSGSLKKEIIGESTFTDNLKNDLSRIASTDVSILITGESGVGKDLIADIIHRYSVRKDNNFMIIDCNMIDENLFESELFGCVKGAYSGASRNRDGKVSLANKGTLYFDSIDALNIHMQGKLLRFLETGEFYPLGASKTKRVDTRIISSSRIDLKGMVNRGLFRKDLLYRINIYPINIIPLRKRVDDIKPIADYILEKNNRVYDTHIEFDESDYNILINYEWPGNIREMENVIERICVENDKNNLMTLSVNSEKQGLKEKIKSITAESEEKEILSALKRTSGNKTEAAKLLMISYRNLLDKIKEYHIE